MCYFNSIHVYPKSQCEPFIFLYSKDHWGLWDCFDKHNKIFETQATRRLRIDSFIFSDLAEHWESPDSCWEVVANDTSLQRLIWQSQDNSSIRLMQELERGVVGKLSLEVKFPTGCNSELCLLSDIQSQREAELTISANTIPTCNIIMNLMSYASSYNCTAIHGAMVGGKHLFFAWLLTEHETAFLCRGTRVPQMEVLRREVIFFKNRCKDVTFITNDSFSISSDMDV